MKITTEKEKFLQILVEETTKAISDNSLEEKRRRRRRRRRGQEFDAQQAAFKDKENQDIETTDLKSSQTTEIPDNWLVRKQENGNVAPGMQKWWDLQTAKVMNTLKKLSEAEEGRWYQTKSSDAEDYEEAFQDFLIVMQQRQDFVEGAEEQRRAWSKYHKPLRKWSFQKNYGKGAPQAAKKFPNYITKIQMERSDLILGGVNPTVFFSDGSKKQFKTPKRALTSANAGRAAWMKSVLVYDGKELSWRYRGNSEGLFDTSLPIGGPWKATSGTLDAGSESLQRLINLIGGRGWTAKESPELQKLKSFGPLPEGTYMLPEPGRRMESVPKELRAKPTLWNNIVYLVQYSRSKMNTGDKKKEIEASIAHNWNNKKAQSVWQAVAWGNHRIKLGNTGSITVDGKRLKIANLANAFGGKDPTGRRKIGKGYRSGFYIHGGTVPGSSGCLDLGDDMDKFAEFWTANFIAAGGKGKSIPLIVKYSDAGTKKIADAVGKAIMANLAGAQQRANAPVEKPEQKATGLAAYDISKFKITGCKGRRPISGKVRAMGVTDKQIYAAIASKLPKELLDKYPKWNVGRPGSKTISLVAHFQAFHFKGDPKEVDGCIGPGTWKALTS